MIAIFINLIALLIFGLAILVVIIALHSHIKSSLLGAPFVGNAWKVIRESLKLAGANSSTTLLDLGSGDGRVLIIAVNAFGVKNAVGYEISLWPRLLTNMRLRFLKDKSKSIKIINKSLFDADIPENAIVYVYLMPKLLEKLAPTLKKEITRKKITVVSPVFKIKGLKPAKVGSAYHKFFRKPVDIYVYR